MIEFRAAHDMLPVNALMTEDGEVIKLNKTGLRQPFFSTGQGKQKVCLRFDLRRQKACARRK